MIGDDVAAALPEMRAHAVSLMRRTCTIERESGSEWDGTKTVPTWIPVHEGIPCRIALPPVTSRSLLTDQAVTSEAPVVKIPHDRAGVKPDDRVTLDDGMIAWVTHVPTYDDMVQIRLQCRWTR